MSNFDSLKVLEFNPPLRIIYFTPKKIVPSSLHIFSASATAKHDTCTNRIEAYECLVEFQPISWKMSELVPHQAGRDLKA